MDAISLGTQPRSSFGKGWARKLRRDGLIPAVIYRAGSEVTHIGLDPHELRSAYFLADNPNVLFALDVEGKTFTCLVKDAEKHPVTRSVLHVDFYEVDAKSPVTVEVPINVVGKALGEATGGRIRIERRTIRLTTLPGNLPNNIDVEVSELDVGDTLNAGQIGVTSGCTLELDDSVLIVTCVGKRADLVIAEPEAPEELEEGEEVEEGEEGEESDEQDEG